MGCPLPLCLAALLFMNLQVVKAQSEEVHLFDVDNPSGERYAEIQLQHSFFYNGKNYTHLYLGIDGYLAFFQPFFNDSDPDLNINKDIIAPLWTKIDKKNGTIMYTQTTSGILVDEATTLIKKMFPDSNNISVSWAFLATWAGVMFKNETGFMEFKVLLFTDDEDNSYIILNYKTIPSSTKQPWLAGYGMENRGFQKLPVTQITDLESDSNISEMGKWGFRVEAKVYDTPVPDLFYSTVDGKELNPSINNKVTFPEPFEYFGILYSFIYVNGNGHLSFHENSGEDVIFPLWTGFNFTKGGKILYQVVTSGPLLSRATNEINQIYHDSSISAKWALIVTWDMMQFTKAGVASFQVVLVSDGDLSYVMMNYRNITATDQTWQAGYMTENAGNQYINEPRTSGLSTGTNVGAPGRWVFRVNIPENVSCNSLNCTDTEMCMEITGQYGCACAKDNPRLNSDTFDASETCSGSSGTLSLSRCQLFEAGFFAEALHLNDPKCKGEIKDGSVIFHFDNEKNVCGTKLRSNETHFFYENAVQMVNGIHPRSVVSRDRWLNINFSCIYPLIKSISMPMSIKPVDGVVSKDLSTEGSYNIHMVPYPNASLNAPYSGEITLGIHQELFVAVVVDGVDSQQISIVLDNCWATPVNDMNFSVRWDLIIHECPNPEDSTVQVLQNGNSTTSLFSFRMFTFTSISDSVYLHCQVHLCLLQGGECAQPCKNQIPVRRRRSLDFHDSAKISMGF